MAGPGGIEVIGLREFRTKIAACSRRQPGLVRKGNNAIGAVIVDEAQRRFPQELSSDPRNVERRTGRLEASVRTLSTAREGRVVEGSPKRIPYAGWWEFGGPKRKSSRPPNRAMVKDGRVLFPAWKDPGVQAAVVENMELVLQALVRFIERGAG